MALVMAVSFPTGIELPSVYHRVTRADLDYEYKMAYMTIKLFKDEQARNDGKYNISESVHAIYSDQFDVYFDSELLSGEGKTVIGSCYEYLKTLPEFAGAIDA